MTLGLGTPEMVPLNRIPDVRHRAIPLTLRWNNVCNVLEASEDT